MKKTIVVLLFMASLGLFSVLVAGEVYVSPHGSDRNAGTKEAPYLTLNRAIKQAREWRRLNRPGGGRRNLYLFGRRGLCTVRPFVYPTGG